MSDGAKPTTAWPMSSASCSCACRAVGLVEDHTCDLPITQAEFADAIGVSTVHVNRVLQEHAGRRADRAQGRRS